MRIKPTEINLTFKKNDLTQSKTWQTANLCSLRQYTKDMSDAGWRLETVLRNSNLTVNGYHSVIQYLEADIK